MDAFGASVSRGAALARFGYAAAIRIFLIFGIFAATAPALGWLLGERFLNIASAVDHWIAFFC
jgi:putative Mn2+ efflux pump MntP